MNTLAELYKPSLGLLADLYQLTMAYGYWKTDMKDLEAVFHLFFRQNPFRGGFTVAAGLATAVEYLENLRYDQAELDCLSTLRGNDEKPLFDRAFLEYLSNLQLLCDVDAVPEGTVVFPNEPLLRIKGPLVQAQLLESAMLNIINFQTLIATKAARVVMAAAGDPVVEFGLRRAQGIDGALSAARAAFIGGVAATSNVLAGRLYGIPVRGTHAHSWVQVFDDEQRAFDVYADAQPDNVTLLVDTYDSLAGVAHAIETGRRLEARGGRLAGIRLDSGDLAYLSVEARRMLDAAGFIETKIVASNDLDEYTIASLREQGARIDIWGVGTRLDTCYDQPALGAIYKLTAICNPDGGWRYPVKLSEHSAKISIPGVLGVRRFVDPSGRFRADMIYDEDLPAPAYGDVIVDPADALHMRAIEPGWIPEELVLPALRSGSRVSPTPSLDDVRARAQAQIRSLHPAIRRLLNPHAYPVGLERALHDRRTELVMQRRLAQPMG